MRILKPVLTFLAIMTSAHAFGATFLVKSTIAEVMSTEAGLGNCSAVLTNYTPPSDCGSEFVTFDCTGKYNSKENARGMFETAQMALALDLPVDVYLVDNQKHNARCVVKRIDVRKE